MFLCVYAMCANVRKEEKKNTKTIATEKQTKKQGKLQTSTHMVHTITALDRRLEYY